MRFAWLGAGTALSIIGVFFGGSAVSGCSTPAPAPEESRVASTTQGIQGGAEDGTAHPFAIGICSGRSVQANGVVRCNGYCSGTLILPNLVVTARHCVDDTDKLIECDKTPPPTFGARKSVWITTHNKMSENVGYHSTKSIIVPTDDHVCGHDIALIVLNDEIAASEAKPAVPAVQYPMWDGTQNYVRRFTAIGFGNTSPTGFSAGTRRIRRTIPIICIPGDPLYPACPAQVDDREFIGGDGTCEGDSGSSAFDDKALLQGKPISFGVLSRGGQSDDGQTCKGSLYTRLDKYRDLVIQAATEASANWTLYPKPSPDWTVYVPPPPDAGAPDAKAPPTDLKDGVACEANEECKSKVCADTGAGKACTIACDEAAPECQEGFVCKESVCVQDLGGNEPAPVAAAPAPTTVTTGCSVTAAAPASPSGRDGSPCTALAVTAAAVLAASLRRRKRAGSGSPSDFGL